MERVTGVTSGCGFVMRGEKGVSSLPGVSRRITSGLST